MILPKLVEETEFTTLKDWPKVHVWANGTVIVEEQEHVLIWDDTQVGDERWRRYEWAALSDFPKANITLTGLKAIKYILERIGPLSETGT
jgi:hypothetical protein